jgi:hypothetical protein
LSSNSIRAFVAEADDAIEQIEDIVPGSTIHAVMAPPTFDDSGSDEVVMLIAATRVTKGKRPLLKEEEETTEEEQGDLVSGAGEKEHLGNADIAVDELCLLAQLFSTLLLPQNSTHDLQKLIAQHIASDGQDCYEQFAQDEVNQQRYIFQNLLKDLP